MEFVSVPKVLSLILITRFNVKFAANLLLTVHYVIQLIIVINVILLLIVYFHVVLAFVIITILRIKIKTVLNAPYKDAFNAKA